MVKGIGKEWKPTGLLDCHQIEYRIETGCGAGTCLYCLNFVVKL